MSVSSRRWRGSHGMRHRRAHPRARTLDLDGLDAITVTQVVQALARWLSRCALLPLRIGERWLDAPAAALRAAVLARLDDPDWSVRLQAAASLGALGDSTAKWDAMASLLARRGGDPVLTDIVLSGARGAESMLLDMLLAEAGGGTTLTSQLAIRRPPAGGRRAIAMLAATMFRASREDEAQYWLARAAGAAERAPTTGVCPRRRAAEAPAMAT